MVGRKNDVDFQSDVRYNTIMDQDKKPVLAITLEVTLNDQDFIKMKKLADLMKVSIPEAMYHSMSHGCADLTSQLSQQPESDEQTSLSEGT